MLTFIRSMWTFGVESDFIRNFQSIMHVVLRYICLTKTVEFRLFIVFEGTTCTNFQSIPCIVLSVYVTKYICLKIFSFKFLHGGALNFSPRKGKVQIPVQVSSSHLLQIHFVSLFKIRNYGDGPHLTPVACIGTGENSSNFNSIFDEVCINIFSLYRLR